MKRFLCAALCLFGVKVASAAIITYSAILSGPNEFPPNTSPGKGVATVVIDDLANTMSLQVCRSGRRHNRRAHSLLHGAAVGGQRGCRDDDAVASALVMVQRRRSKKSRPLL